MGFRLAVVSMIGCALLGCFPEKVKETGQKEVARQAYAAEAPALLASWIGELAKNSNAIVTLAESNEGWSKLFNSDPFSAAAAFRNGNLTDPDILIGLTRAYLELANTFSALEELSLDVNRALVKAQLERPGSGVDVRWARFTATRLGIKGPESVPAAVDDFEKGLDALLEALKTGGLNGQSQLPDMCTRAYAARLRIYALLTDGKVRAARKLWGKVRMDEPDVRVVRNGQTIGFYDPALAGLGKLYFAAEALESSKDLTGWARIYRAQAQQLLKQWDASLVSLREVGVPTETPRFSMLFLSAYLDVATLQARQKALEVKALSSIGKSAEALKAYDSMDRGRVDLRVEAAYAGSVLDVKAGDGFPEDRGVLTKIITDALAGLGEGAKGLPDLDALEVTDRFVDGLQRRYADALRRSGKTALAAKHRSAAEDKVAALSPSRRNSLSALTKSALENYGIARPRVALKYLTRLNTRLTSVVGASEQLRELLSFRALEKGGGVSVGQ